MDAPHAAAPEPSTLGIFFYLIRGHRASLVAVSAVACLVTALDSLGLGAVYPLIKLSGAPAAGDAAAVFGPLAAWLPASLAQLHTVAALLVLAYTLKAVVSHGFNRLMFTVCFGVEATLRERLFSAYLTLAPQSFHRRRHTTGLAQTALISTADLTGVLGNVIQGASSLVLVCGLVLVLLLTDPVTAVTLGGGGLAAYLAYVRTMRGKLHQLSAEDHESYGFVASTMHDGLSAVTEIRMLQCEDFFVGRMAHGLARRVSVQLRLSSVVRVPRLVFETLLITAVTGVCVVVAAHGATTDLFPKLGVFAIAAVRLVPAFNQIVNMTSELRLRTRQIRGIYRDLTELEGNGRVVTALGPGAAPAPGLPLAREVRFEAVDFAHAGRAALFRGVTLSVARGQLVGLVGPSGAGKSTLVDLLLGLVPPSRGRILIDGVPLAGREAAWQRSVGYMPQTTLILDDTIERNIAFGVPDAQIDRGRVDEAVAAARLLPLVAELPEGLMTAAGERGARISGGQRQRIGIARALYHEREFLVFDEPTSALDAATAQGVFETIRALKGEKTIVIVSHDAAVLDHCDVVYRIEHGALAKVSRRAATPAASA